MTILITGASRGIGAQLALELAKEKHKIVLLSRNEKGLEKICSECNKLAGEKIASFMVYDLKELEKSHGDFILRLKEHTTELNCLVNNAGALIRKPFDEIGIAESKDMFDVNFFAPAMLIQATLPLLKASGKASIVNVTSMAAVQGGSKFGGLSMYSASKGALATLTESLAEEFETDGIRVNALAFGAVQTEMLEEAFPGYQAPITAEGMGKFFKWFVLEGSKYFNGKMLPVTVSTP
jgi:3-oxoacyl-[acyl-carrier protein] reductase